MWFFFLFIFAIKLLAKTFPVRCGSISNGNEVGKCVHSSILNGNLLQRDCCSQVSCVFYTVARLIHRLSAEQSYAKTFPPARHHCPTDTGCACDSVHHSNDSHTICARSSTTTSCSVLSTYYQGWFDPKNGRGCVTHTARNVNSKTSNAVTGWKFRQTLAESTS